MDLEVQVNNMDTQEFKFVKDFVSMRYAHKVPAVLLDDLIQEGMIAYWKAAENYDPEKGVPLKGYAAACISGRVKNFIRDKTRLIRTPRDGKSEHYTFQSEYFTVVDSDNNETVNFAMVSEDDLTDSEMYLSAYYDLLNERELKIIEMSLDGYSQHQIAPVMGISQMTVSRTVQKIREKIRGVLNESTHCH